MAIALPIPGSPDQITTYDGLVSAIQNYLKDTTLESHAPRFIALAEARFNRVLVNPDFEETVTIAADASVSLPPDYREIRSVYIDGNIPLTYVSPDFLRNVLADSPNGTPIYYTVIGGELSLAPAPADTYTITLSYTRVLTALSSDNQTNWLSERHPDLYLYGSIIHAEYYGWNDERIPMLKEGVDEMLAEINGEGNRRRAGGRLIMRPPVSV